MEPITPTILLLIILATLIAYLQGHADGSSDKPPRPPLLLL